MYSREEIMQILKEKEVLLEGHFLLSSGRHAGFYLQCARLLQYPETAGPLCTQLAQQFAGMGVTVVAGPATGAIVISYEVARALGVRSVFSERENGQMCFRRGFEISPDDKVLVVEDVVTTGGSGKEVIAAVRALGAQVAAAGAIADRSGGKVDMEVPFKALITLEIESFPAAECPLCANGSKAVKPGSKQF